MKIVRLRALLPVLALAVLAGGTAHAEHTATGRYDLAFTVVSNTPCNDTSIGGARVCAGDSGGEEILAVKVADDASPLIPSIVVCQDSNADLTCGGAGEPRVAANCVAPQEIALDHPAAGRPKFDPNVDIVTFVTIAPGGGACRTAFATSGTVTIRYGLNPNE